MGEQTKEAIISAVGLSLIQFYWIEGPLAMSILFLMLIWGLGEAAVVTIMRTFAIYR